MIRCRVAVNEKAYGGIWEENATKKKRLKILGMTDYDYKSGFFFLSFFLIENEKKDNKVTALSSMKERAQTQNFKRKRWMF